MIFLLWMGCTGEAQEAEVPDAGNDDPFGDAAEDSGGGRDSDHDTDDDDTGPDDPPDDCEIVVQSTVPTQGAVDAYYRGPFEFHLNQRYPDATLAADFPGVPAMLEGGEIWTWTPAAPLSPNTAYAVSINTCAGRSELDFTTSDLGSTLVQPLDLIGTPFLVEFDDARFVKPPNVGSILQQYMTSGLYLVPTAHDETSIVMFGATTLPESADQAYCAPTVDLPAGTFDDVGYFSLGGGGSYVVQVSGMDVEISDLTIEGTFAPDGLYFGGGRISGNIDTRPLDTLVDEEAEEGYVCDLLVGLGTSCVPCANGERFCIELEIDQLFGDAQFTDVVEIEGTDCLGCLDGPPPDVSDTCEIDSDAEAAGPSCATVPAGQMVAWAGVLAIFARRGRRQP